MIFFIRRASHVNEIEFLILRILHHQLWSIGFQSTICMYTEEGAISVCSSISIYSVVGVYYLLQVIMQIK